MAKKRQKIDRGLPAAVWLSHLIQEQRPELSRDVPALVDCCIDLIGKIYHADRTENGQLLAAQKILEDIAARAKQKRFVVERTKGGWIVRDTDAAGRPKNSPAGLAAGPYDNEVLAIVTARALNDDPSWKQENKT